MAGFSDVLAEFKNATPGEKALMIVAIIAVAGAGIYIYKQRQASSTSGTGGTLVPIGSDAGSGDTSTGATNGTGTGNSTGSTSGTTGTTAVAPPSPATTPTPIGTGSTSGTGTSGTGHANGTTFLGPTGVLHYVATGTETLSQIAAKFGLNTWNAIYAIPDNQKLFGAMNANSARGYKPKAGLTITLPSNSNTNSNASSSSSSSSSASKAATRTVINGNPTSGTWVTISKGGTLWGLSQQFYGNGAQWGRIAQANKISNPSSLQVGQKIFIPK